METVLYDQNQFHEQKSNILDQKTVYVLDTYGILYQVFHTMREMSSPQGEPTGAVFGFVRDILTLLSQHTMDYAFCAFDVHAPTFRHELFADYKANREAMPVDLRPQVDFVREILHIMGIPSLLCAGFEADDLLATVAAQTEQAGGKCVLVTADKDARQLITDNTRLFNLRKQAFYAKEELWSDWGIRPDQVVDFQTMVGDSTDNIAGIPLIGPKSATSLLQEFDSLENIYTHLDQIKGKKRENLENSRDVVQLSRQLVQLRQDVPLQIDWERQRLAGVDSEALTAIFQYLGFRSFIPKIDVLTKKWGVQKHSPIALSDSLWEKIQKQQTKSFFPGREGASTLFSDLNSLLSQPSEEVGAEKNETETDPKSDEEMNKALRTSMPLFFTLETAETSSQKSGEKEVLPQRDAGAQAYGLMDRTAPTQGVAPESNKIALASTLEWPQKGIPTELTLENPGDSALTGRPLKLDQQKNADSPQTHFQLPPSVSESGEIKTRFFSHPSCVLPPIDRHLVETIVSNLSGSDQGSALGKPTWHLVDSAEKFDEFLEKLSKVSFVSLDLETTDLRPRFAKIVGMAACFDAENAWYLPFRGPLGSELLEESSTLAALRPMLESRDILKIGQNIKYDMIVFRNRGIRVRGVVFDTILADYLLHAGSYNHNLDALAEIYLNHQTIKISELIGSGKKQKKMNEIPTDIVAKYAGEDALVPWFLYPVLMTELQKQPGLLQVLTELELPILEILVEMEYAGILIDPVHFKSLSKELEGKLAELEKKIRAMVSTIDPDPVFADSFNLNSTQQIQRILFDDLKLPVIKKTKTGRSTDIEVLEELAKRHPLAEMLIEHRQWVKLKGTYIDPLPLLVHPETRRIHASFNQIVTATGRLSSSDPNLQNIPVRNEQGKQIRQGFVPDSSKGFDCLLSCDYSQIELRVLAHFSGDPALQQAFREDRDIHAQVASTIFGVSIDEVTSEMRRKAKAVNFGLVYGQSAFGLSKSIDISRDEAAAYIESFFATYEGIQEFFDRVLFDCHHNGYVETLLGHRRQIAGVRGHSGVRQLNMGERTAINTVIQGSAADLMKWAMICVFRRLYESENAMAPSNTQLLLQIHDELVFETERSFVDELARVIVQEMELGQPLSVPLKIDSEVMQHWGEF